MIKTSVPLADAVGKHISHFCSFDLAKKNGENHCAHLVSHLLGYEFATTCKNQTSVEKKKTEKGAAIRVNEIFNRCADRGVWSARPLHLSSCLIFVTHESNTRDAGHLLEMLNHRKKHIGIYICGAVWHYSNLQDQVVQDSEEGFMQTFTRAYHEAGKRVQYYYGAPL